MTEPKSRPFQFSLSGLLAFVVVCAMILSAWRWWQYEEVFPLKDAHAGIQVAAMINAYLNANESAWPKSWDDLREFYRVKGIVSGSDYCTFEEVRESWAVDFDVDPVELAQAKTVPEEPPFRVIYPRHRRPSIRPEWEPNVRVYTRLRGFAGLQVGAMVIEYMKANGRAWPGNWDDLRASYPSALKPKGGHYCSFEMAQGVMEVDFTADPAELALVAKPRGIESPFLVVYARHGETYPGSWDPNRLIFKYLTSQPTVVNS